jgi:membrane-associated phospholipid phosphatase
MENLLNIGIQIIIWLQGIGEWFTPVMKFFTFLGNEQFYLLIAPAILWCIDSTLGMRLGLFLMVNGMLNSALKIAFHGPRPYWYTNDAKALSSAENSFGAPSGHAQNAVVVWGTLAEWIRKRWFWVTAIFIMLLIGVSRVYLAVHFPHDVLLGWIFGIIIFWFLLKLEKPVLKWVKKYSAGIQVLIAFLFSLLLILIVMIAQLSVHGWNLPVDWIKNAQLSFTDEPAINPLSFHNFLSSAGAFFGLTAGWIWISWLGGFSIQDIWWKLVLRYIVGLLGVLILYVGLGTLFTDDETLISYALRYIRYALIGFWMSGCAPWLFLKLHLASQLKKSL